MFIIKREKGLEQEIPVLFPSLLVHIEVARAMKPCMHRHFENTDISVVSAGDFNAIDCECSGGSETLRVNSRPQDGNIILSHDYLHGIVPMDGGSHLGKQRPSDK
jgi:hypothetical protein